MSKGFEMSLKAIFTMIAGVVILIFFVNFALEQKDIKEEINLRESVTSLDDQLDAFAISESSSKTINFPDKARIDFRCEDIEAEGYSKGDEKIIFSDDIDSSEIRAWTLAWDFPFEIANFFYLTDNRRFLLVYNQNSFEFVNSLDFPKAFNVQKQELRFFDAERLDKEIGDNKITIAFFVPVNPSETKQKLKNADIVVVDTENDELNINGENDFYLGKEMLLGALFDPKEYGCLKSKAMTRLKDITLIYSGKASLLSQKSDQKCRNYLFEAKNSLETFKRQDDNEGLYKMKEKIEKQNRELEKNGCKKIY